MLKKGFQTALACILSFLLCGYIQNTTLSSQKENDYIQLKQSLLTRKKINLKAYKKYVSDPLMDKQTLKFLHKLYQLPAKNTCIFSVAGCFSFKSNQLFKETENGYQPLELKETSKLNCDFRDITGKNPLLNGVELMYALDEYWCLFTNEIVPSGDNINEKYYSYLVSHIKKAYDVYGSIPVITYHIANPYSPLPPKRYGAYSEYKDKEHRNVVSEMRMRTGTRCGYKNEYINPREYLDNKLVSIADFISELKDRQGKPIPCILRLFHEMDMNSFWWGVDYCTAEDYKWLYCYSIDVIREKIGTHNLILGYSLGNKFTTYEEMIERYPGDEYVDIIGGDEYNLGAYISETKNSVIRSVLITRESIKRNKVGGLFECGISNFEGRDQLINESYYSKQLPSLLSRDDVFFSFILGYNGPFSMPTTHEGKKQMRDFTRSNLIY